MDDHDRHAAEIRLAPSPILAVSMDGGHHGRTVSEQYREALAR